MSFEAIRGLLILSYWRDETKPRRYQRMMLPVDESPINKLQSFIIKKNKIVKLIMLIWKVFIELSGSFGPLQHSYVHKEIQ